MYREEIRYILFVSVIIYCLNLSHDHQKSRQQLYIFCIILLPFRWFIPLKLKQVIYMSIYRPPRRVGGKVFL